MEEVKKKGRGGARPGSGRKRLGAEQRISLTLSIDPEAKKKLQQKADEANLSMSQYIDRLLSNL